MKFRYSGYWRWLPFLVAIFLTYAFIVGNVTDESGVSISDEQRLVWISIILPMIWGMEFIPNEQVVQLCVDRSGVSTLNLASKTIFHRRAFTNLFVSAKDISRIEIDEDAEENGLPVKIWFNQGTGSLDYIEMSSYRDISSATNEATKAASLIGCEVKPLGNTGITVWHRPFRS